MHVFVVDIAYFLFLSLFCIMIRFYGFMWILLDVEKKFGFLDLCFEFIGFLDLWDTLLHVQVYMGCEASPHQYGMHNGGQVYMGCTASPYQYGECVAQPSQYGVRGSTNPSLCVVRCTSISVWSIWCEMILTSWIFFWDFTWFSKFYVKPNFEDEIQFKGGRM